MSRGFYAKLAAGNIRKNGRTYLPYLLTCILTVAMYYIVKSLSMNPGLQKMIGADTIAYVMFLGSLIIMLFAAIFLFYTNSFLIRQRKKEFGVFNILGMDKRHLARVLRWETFYTALISLSAGLLIGIALDKMMFLLVGRVIGAKIVLGFFLSRHALVQTILSFCVIFFLIYLNAVHQIRIADPIELLRGGNVGEKEPKTKWLMTILGTVCIGGGYYLAITTKNPVASLNLFFVAVLLVIVGTYLLFTAGSIALLKFLRSRKSYYYQTRHFTSVSGMIYRMKQNAVGLANICILSTMVLVMVSSTTALMLGMEDIIKERYPNDFVIYSDEPTEARSRELFAKVRALQEKEEIPVTRETEYTYLGFSGIRDGDTFRVGEKGSLADMDSISILFFVTLEDYNRVMGENQSLSKGEVLLYSNRAEYDEPQVHLFDRTYKVKKKLKTFLGNGVVAANVANSQFLVVRDGEELQELYGLQKEALGERASNIREFYGFDTNVGEKKERAFFKKMSEMLLAEEAQGTVESSLDARQSFLGLYGGFFFIGIFLGFLFIMATVLIIYYKQISEGYDDRERFVIMQKVGMSHQEVRHSIRSQILTVFFLPLLAAGVHVAAAFPMISRILEIMMLNNTALYVKCTIGCFLVFAAMYLLIYWLTARTYYKIVSR